jgi:hypothetical protein
MDDKKLDTQQRITVCFNNLRTGFNDYDSYQCEKDILRIIDDVL